MNTEELASMINEDAMNIDPNILPHADSIKHESALNIFNAQHLQHAQLQLNHQQQAQPLLAQPQYQEQLHHQQQQQHHRLDLAHLSRIPNLATIQTAYEFDVLVPPDSNVVFVTPKLYIKMNSKMTINAIYRRPNPDEPLFVRAMVIFSNPAEMGTPVKRCANHRVVNSDPEAKNANILKVNDPKALYQGREDGQTFNDRLSVVVPLESNELDDKGRFTQIIGLEFACQNSCSSGINRRPTSIVFTLENQAGELVGKAAIEFKVCSCPKRDSERDQREKLKRKNTASCSFPRGKYPKNPQLQLVKTEPEESDSDSTNEPMNGGAEWKVSEVLINFPSDMVPDLLKNAHDMIAGRMAEGSKHSTNYENLMEMMKDLKKMRKKAIQKA